MYRLEAQVFGKVQGVAFRAFAIREAQRLGIVGTVDNFSDGSVSVVAEGNRVVLQSFLSRLHEGPRDAKVERIEVKWSEAQGKHKGFESSF